MIGCFVQVGSGAAAGLARMAAAVPAMGRARVTLVGTGAEAVVAVHREEEPVAVAVAGRQVAAVLGHPVDTRTGQAVTAAAVLAAEAAGALDALARAMSGDFAVVLVDWSRSAVVVVADHLALRPLFVHAGPGGLVVGSDVWPMVASGMVPLTLDQDALAAWIVLDYTLADQTLFAGIRKVRPGTLMRWEAGRLRPEAYRPVPGRAAPAVRSQDELVEALDEAVVAHLRRHLPPGVPVHLFLSGGLDSRWIAGALARLEVPARAYNVPYDSAERALSAEVARRLGLPLEVYPLRGSLVDEYGDPLRWNAWGFPVRKHATLLPIQRHHLAGIGLDGLLGEWLRLEDEWRTRLLPLFEHRASLAQVAYSRQRQVPPEALFAAPLARAMSARAASSIERDLARPDLSEPHQFYVWEMLNRSSNYTANVHLQSLPWLESVHPLAIPQLIDLVFSVPFSWLNVDTYRRLFALRYARVADLPMASDLPKTDQRANAWSWFHWRRTPGYLRGIRAAPPTLGLHKGGMAWRLAATLPRYPRWQYLAEPIDRILRLAVRLEAAGTELVFSD